MFFCVYYWVLLSFLILFPGLTGICGFFLGFFLKLSYTGFSLVWIDFWKSFYLQCFTWFSPGFFLFQWVVLGFYWVYRVLPSFTGCDVASSRKGVARVGVERPSSCLTGYYHPVTEFSFLSFFLSRFFLFLVWLLSGCLRPSQPSRTEFHFVLPSL